MVAAEWEKAGSIFQYLRDKLDFLHFLSAVVSAGRSENEKKGGMEELIKTGKGF